MPKTQNATVSRCAAVGRSSLTEPTIANIERTNQLKSHIERGIFSVPTVLRGLRGENSTQPIPFTSSTTASEPALRSFENLLILPATPTTPGTPPHPGTKATQLCPAIHLARGQ